MNSTKRIADSMETQTAIMTEVYERNIAPIFKPIFVSNYAREEAKIDFRLYNFGKEIFTVIKADTRIWNEDNPNEILQVIEESVYHDVIPGVDADLSLNFKLDAKVARYYPDKERKIKWETTFFVKDVLGREHSFPAGKRSLF